ncbi:hypothetical protein JDV02_008294 [Purpureocillium takamizusanense]|uniref:Uncharacterized protein n=1 Tax=Purpureocillium takamizusanense TaxID=2060973 RepID=A0A9Q8QMG7_9HYPO|nr:uncharacterized protein JDV02_008294 [Purpureocillium takamizusanense]UNI22403.1 hypothetical protein JDV02_008294 [Purpureocillium takamizusanense]
MPGYTSAQVSDLLAGLKAKLDPDSTCSEPPTDQELQFMAHQLTVYYHHWDVLDDETRHELDDAHCLWEKEAVAPGRPEYVWRLALELMAKQLAVRRR